MGAWLKFLRFYNRNVKVLWHLLQLNKMTEFSFTLLFCFHLSVNTRSTQALSFSFFPSLLHFSLLRCALVWPYIGMWRGAGNVWTMKACVYAGCSWSSPASGKTDTTGLFPFPVLSVSFYASFLLSCTHKDLFLTFHDSLNFLPS